MSCRRVILVLFWILLSRILCPESGQIWAGSAALRPVGDRGGAQWTVYPSGERWDAINDTTTNEDTNYVWTNTTGYDEGWYHTDFSASNNIDSVRLTIRARSPATSGTPQLIFGRRHWDGEFWNWCTEDAGIDTINLNSSYANHSVTWGKDPYDNSSWDMNKLNSAARAWVFSNKTTGAVPDSFGLYSGNGKSNAGPDYVDAVRCSTGSNGGTLTHIRLLFDDASPNGSVKMAIYSDSSNYPKTLLWGDNTGQTIINDWVSVSTNGINLSANTVYWLCFNNSVGNDVRKQTGGVANSHRWRAYDFNNDWPDSWNNTWGGGNTSRYVIKGIYGVAQDNRVTQSYIEVFYSAAAAKRQGGIVQDEDNRGIAEGGIAR